MLALSTSCRFLIFAIASEGKIVVISIIRTHGAAEGWDETIRPPVFLV